MGVSFHLPSALFNKQSIVVIIIFIANLELIQNNSLSAKMIHVLWKGTKINKNFFYFNKITAHFVSGKNKNKNKILLRVSF